MLPRDAYRGLFDLSGKVAVVTGGGGILGRHFVAGLAANGAQVALLDSDHAAIQGVVQDADANLGARPLAIACDITERDDVRMALDRIERELGPVDILHNNAATKGRSLSAFLATDENYERETWREVMAVNLDAMFLMAQEVGPRMIGRKRGSIIQTASIYAIIGPDRRIYEGSHYQGQPISTPAVYSASKAGVVGLSRHLATMWAEHNVRVNTLTPGGVESGQNVTFNQKYAARVPLQRMARAEEMVGALVFLASDASSYVTGQNIVVDGGLSAW
jgi:NAD(P)-dependent dehydrogenase (short-subunit alcohol dehydrogenase family)